MKFELTEHSGRCSIIRRICFLALFLFATSAIGMAQQGYVGAVFDFMDPMTAAKYGLIQGATFVRSVVPGGPAEKSGLRGGDLITSVDGVPMRSPAQIAEALRAHRPGSQATVGIIHPMGSRSMSIEIMVSIGSAPAGGSQSMPSQTDLGDRTPHDPRWNSGGQMNGQSRTEAKVAQPSQQGPCRAMLPAGWQLQAGQDGQTAMITGPNGANAAWGIVGVNPAMRQYYGDMFGPPEAHAAAVVAQLLQARPQFVSSQNVAGFYTAHRFQAGYSAGIILYHVYPAPMPGQYIITEYVAWAPQGDGALLSQAEAVMTSLQCTSRMHPSQPVRYEPRTGVPEHRRSSGSEETDSLKDYNSTLGTQYAHDPSTGTVYLLDRSSDYHSDCPDGPGYCIGTGVNRHQLIPGEQ